MSEELRTFAKSERQFCFHPYAGALERAADELDRLHSMTAWRPMETAPKNYEPILAGADGKTPAVVWWSCQEETWQGHRGSFPSGYFTRWLPLPEKQ